MESYTDISIYGRHIRSYESYTVCEKWTIYGPKTTIYGSHRTKTYMVVIYGRDHIWSGPVYDSNPRPYMGDHIWCGPYMVLLTIYGRINFWPYIPYMVLMTIYGRSNFGPYMVDQSYTVNHIWFMICGANIWSVYIRGIFKNTPKKWCGATQVGTLPRWDVKKV